MSWLVSSIANSLRLDDDEEDDESTKSASSAGDNPSPSQPRNPNSSSGDPQPSDQETTARRGVKEDLSELSQTLSRQLWGVASFLAPPPQIPDGNTADVSGDAPAAGISGIRSDLSEIGGRFRTGISKLSSNKAVSEFTKIASNLLQIGSEEGLTVEDYAERGVVGVTDQVVAFARDVALHPETWLDFPLPEDDDQDFDLSDAQQEHALAVERLAPELAALRTELCLSYMSEANFWKIYFVLVHPRLSKHDAEILSTPEIVKARAMLSLESHSHGKPRPYVSGSGNAPADITELPREEHLSVPDSDQSESVPVEISAVEPASSVEVPLEMDKHTVTSTEIPVVDKAVVEEGPMNQTITEKPTTSTFDKVEHKDEDSDDADDWLQEENTEAGTSKGTSYPIGDDDEDISFSDLEEDEDVPAPTNKVQNTTSSAKESNEWVQLSSRSAESGKVSSHSLKNKESNDWLDLENLDVA